MFEGLRPEKVVIYREYDGSIVKLFLRTAVLGCLGALVFVLGAVIYYGHDFAVVCFNEPQEAVIWVEFTIAVVAFVFHYFDLKFTNFIYDLSIRGNNGKKED